MTGWGGGYVTDVPYTLSYYPHQAPMHLAVACLLGGAECTIPAEARLSYLELGCGQGFGASVLAASNPDWRFTAVDFNPAHIAAARRTAVEAGLDNIVFIEADLATLVADPAAATIPEADVVSLHGVWSWVSAPVRDGIVRLLAAKVRPGGLVHLSYNALPAWQGALGMQRLLREAGPRLATRSDRQVIAGLQLAQQLIEAEAAQLQTPMVKRLMTRLASAPPEYLAHEYMNASWSPCFHAEVVDAMTLAKLDWVGSAQLPENFPELMLTQAQRDVFERFDDPRLRELIKDLSVERSLREDLFVRGARRLDRAGRDAALRALTLALTGRAEEFVYEVDLSAGRVTLAREFYAPVVAALGDGPQRVGDLLALPELAGRRDNPAELVGILMGTGQAIAVARRHAGDSERLRRFNRVTSQRLVRVDQFKGTAALPSVRLGAGLPCSAIELFVADRLADGGAPDPDKWTAELGAELDQADRGKLRGLLARVLEERLGPWRHAGVRTTTS